VARIIGSTFGQVGDELTFDGSSSSDSDGSIVSYEWDFGDGTTTTGAIVTHIFKAPGTCAVTLKVTDDDGAPNTATLSVRID
jgi:PKD repeat protein